MTIIVTTSPRQDIAEAIASAIDHAFPGYPTVAELATAAFDTLPEYGTLWDLAEANGVDRGTLLQAVQKHRLAGAIQLMPSDSRIGMWLIPVVSFNAWLLLHRERAAKRVKA